MVDVYIDSSAYKVPDNWVAVPKPVQYVPGDFLGDKAYVVAKPLGWLHDGVFTAVSKCPQEFIVKDEKPSTPKRPESYTPEDMANNIMELVNSQWKVALGNNMRADDYKSCHSYILGLLGQAELYNNGNGVRQGLQFVKESIVEVIDDLNKGHENKT
jgi:hypothetical protein